MSSTPRPAGRVFDVFCFLGWCAMMLFAIPAGLIHDACGLPCAAGCGKRRPLDDVEAKWKGWTTWTRRDGTPAAVCGDDWWKPGAWREANR